MIILGFIWEQSLNKTLLASAICLSLGGVLASVYLAVVSPKQMYSHETIDQALQAQAQMELSDNQLAILPHTTSHRVEPGSNSYLALREAQIDRGDVLKILESSKEVYDLSRIRAKVVFMVAWQDEAEQSASAVMFHLAPTTRLLIQKVDSEWQAEMIELPVSAPSRTFVGVVQQSLWDSAANAGMDPQLISDLAQIFAWQIDFSREVRSGDRWRITVEELFADNRPIGWGNILAAEYVNAGESFSAVRFPQTGDDASYYAPDGSSLKRMFLKSPVRFGRISSRFKRRRFHPILKRNIPHNGVDYAARTGTPVRSVGKGKVIKAGRYGGSGIMVRLRHNSVYQTAYLHLSKIARGVSRGKTVKQGQIIGYVGQTGLATGPHLHFSFYENGRFVDPLGRKFPSKDPVSKKLLPEYLQVAEQSLRTLPQWPPESSAKIARQN